MEIEGGWIPTKEAAKYLGCSVSWVRRLGLAGKIRRWHPDEGKVCQTAYYSWNDVLDLRFESFRAKRRLRLMWMLEEGFETEWISTKEAAKILEVRQNYVRTMIYRGLLFSRRECKTGNRGILKVSRRQVEKYQWNRERLEKREIYDRDLRHSLRPHRELATAEEMSVYEQKKWLTAAEAAHCLGVSVGVVYKYRGVRMLRSFSPNNLRRSPQRWTFLIDDVKRLRDDPKHQAHRAKWQETFSEEAVSKRHCDALDKFVQKYYTHSKTHEHEGYADPNRVDIALIPSPESSGMGARGEGETR